MVCPVCGGGSTAEECMSLWEINDGVYATCHRANCDVGTTLLRDNRVTVDRTERDSYQTARQAEGTYRWRQYNTLDGALYQCEYEDHDRGVVVDYLDTYEAFRDIATEVPFKFIVGHSDGNIYLPMYNYSGDEVGVIVKPNTDGGPKSLTYKYDRAYDGMSWYLRADYMARPEIYLVEDGLSAIALYMYGKDAVSLNGTLLNNARVEAILDKKYKMVICLDADATGKAIGWKRRWPFYDVEVRRLVKDIKNMNPEELGNFLGLELSNYLPAKA
jgi:hypothetical protein